MSYHTSTYTYWMQCIDRLTDICTDFYGHPAWQMRTLYFHHVVSSFFLCSIFFFPHLISAVADWMSTILPHMVWP